MPVMVGYCVFFGQIPEYQKDDVLIVPFLFLLGIGPLVLTPLTALGLVPLPVSIGHSGVVGVVRVVSILGPV